MDRTVMMYRTKHLHVSKIVCSGLVRYWVSYNDCIGSYGCYKDLDYAIEVCDYLEDNGFY